MRERVGERVRRRRRKRGVWSVLKVRLMGCYGGY